MLSPDQVLPFLLHEDEDVRNHAVDYLADGYDAVPALVPVTADHIWASVDRFGIERSTRLLRRLSDVPQTAASLSRAAAALAGSADEDAALHLQGVFGNVDFETLLARRHELLQVKGLHPAVRDHLAERLALS